MKDNHNYWYIITGAPSSGKTTTLLDLEQQGHKVVHEAARYYIDQELAKGKTLGEIRADEEAFQQEVLRLKLEFETQHAPEEQLFFDRGIPDTIAYCRLYNFPIDHYLNWAAAQSRYRKIFILEPLTFELDYARTENGEQAKKLDQLLESSYRDLGFTVVRVPAISIEDRTTFILENR